MNDIVIGIDLGTTNTCAAYFTNGVVEILENSDGKRLTPSCVFFNKKSELIPVVGQLAKKMMQMIPENGIYEIKRFIGRNFNEVKKYLQYFSFNVININDNPVIEIEEDDKTLKNTPLDITALILAQIKKDVDQKLGFSVTKAVITVPAYFNSSQREDTLAAANKAGFTVLKLFNEPTAAALSYFFRRDDEGDSYSLVYDLGGGTFDVSVLKRCIDSIDIICVGGDTNLGGKDLDNLITEYVCKELKRLYKYDLKKDRRAMRRLQNKCEEAKIELSTVKETVIIFENFIADECMVTISITREQFENLANSLFKKTISIVQRSLKDSDTPASMIKNVILAGGSSRIPKIQSMLKKIFSEANVTRFLNLDECVAEGAAIQAALLSNHPKQNIKKIKITDVTRLSIGIKDFVGRMNVIIPRNSPIPVSNSTTFANVIDNQSSCEISVYEGERVDVEKNFHLDTISLEGLTPAPPNCCKLHVTFIIDNDGILKVKASEYFNDNDKSLMVKYNPGTKNDFEIANVIADTEQRKEEDFRFEQFAAKKEYFINYCRFVNFNLKYLNLKHKYCSIYKLCDKLLYEVNAMTIAEEKSLEELTDEIERKCASLVELYNFVDMPCRQKLQSHSIIKNQ